MRSITARSGISSMISRSREKVRGDASQRRHAEAAHDRDRGVEGRAVELLVLDERQGLVREAAHGGEASKEACDEEEARVGAKPATGDAAKEQDGDREAAGEVHEDRAP